MTSKPLKIIFMVMEGVGRISACIGLSQALQKRGHFIYFLTNCGNSGTFTKHGFEEINIRLESKEKPKPKVEHPLNAMIELLEKLRVSGMLSSKSPFEKLDIFSADHPDSFMKTVLDEMIEMHGQLEEIINKEKPDLFILDHLLIAPCILFGNIPWILSWSPAPLMLLDSPELPPMCSGLPSNDRSGWSEFQTKLDKTLRSCFRHYQLELLKHFGYDSIPDRFSKHFFIHSPYLNIYAYPSEIDYSDKIHLPENYFRIDAFCRENPEPFEWPEEFLKKLKPGDKLVYLSMGSMGSIDVDLMTRLIQPLIKTPYKYVVSQGAMHEHYQLGDNMWGKPYLPQTSILPLVDLVITHGGNNTVTETFFYGKPMLVLPLFGDQPENAQRITEKGYGYKLDPYKFTEQELIDTLNLIMNDEEMIMRCKKSAQRIQKDNLKEKVCIEIERIIGKHT